MSTSSTVHTKLDLSDSSSYLPSNLFQPRTTFFNRKQTSSGIQQLLLRRNRLDSLRIYAKALSQLKQHLTELSLRENNFMTFPGEVAVLKNLTSLSLANNRLKIIENEMLSSLIHLQWLNLSHNQLTELPLDIVCCHHLRGLDLEDNLISSFPVVIFYLTRLEVLLIQKNQIKTIPTNYDFPPTVNTLNLSFNQFMQIPSTLLYKPPESLTHLHLSGNKLRNLSPKFLSTGYKKLISLDLHTCQLTRCSPKLFERLSKCPDLRRLNLAINRLADLPSEIGLLNQLQWLNLNDNLISVLPSTLSDLTHLVKLGLVQNKIQVLPPFMFLHMLELQKLDIRRNLLKYMPPSILALAPRQEVDVHVDLAVPHSVFQSLSNPVCTTGDLVEKNCLDGHPYGGSLRTLLFYENPTVEHVDGILCDLGDDPGSPESVQTMSMANIYNVLKSSPSPRTIKTWLRQSLFPIQKNVLHCNHPKFKRSDHPMPNMLSEIDDEGNESQDEQDTETDDEEVNAIRIETQQILTQVMSLRELTLRSHLTRRHASKRSLVQQQRLDQKPDQASLFIKHALPNSVVPTMMQLITLQEAKQCDFCACWYTDSRCQIGYLARLCNNRLQIPIRFNVCSTECTLDAVIRLYQTTTDWHTRQSLAHIDATLLLPPQQSQDLTRPGTSANYWNVGLSRSPVISATTVSPMHRTLGLERGDLEEEQENTVQSNASSSTTLSTVSTLSLTRQSSLARSLRNRVVQLASTIFNYNHELSAPQFLPLVFPQATEEPPSVVSVTTRMVDGRLHTERTQPQLRLATPTPNPTAFHHLPRDAIRLEKF
ncbi:hypothetical protein HPULCUR_007304 [Helicostylum pulchrum]|uniref:Uncharacterized protein n=1 Tax=Helicostylum pulchrum TaxID=562976 RepID=A0ABP9Y4D9_9FUNG